MSEIEGARGRPFRWGQHDCVLWAGDAVLAMTGHDLVAPFRGAYDSPETAASLCLALAGGGLDAAVAAIMAQWDCPEVAPGFARRGDLAFLDSPRLSTEAGPGLGIVTGEHIAIAAATGVTLRRRDEVLRAWRIG